MALAALIAACAQVDSGGEGLRATLPLVGATLLEHQVRLARRAGAAHVVVLVERMPAALTAAFDRLRRDGIAVDIARTAADAADRIHPDEKLLVFADGCLPGQPLLDRLVAATPPALITVPDHSERQNFERIDSLTRWGGLALIQGAHLRRTVAMLGEWDMLSTLLRRTLQQGAIRIDAFPPDEPASRELLLIANSAAALEGVDRRLIEASRSRASTWPGRYVFPPIEELALRPLAGRGIEPMWLAIAAAVAAFLSVPAALLGWRWPMLVLLLLSGPLIAIALRLAGTRLATVRHDRLLGRLRDAGAAGALLALGYDLATVRGWGMMAIAALAVLGALALGVERATLARLGGPVPRPWLASPDGMIWAMLPFAAAGAWDFGLWALAIYLFVSFFLVQRAVMVRAAGAV
ncbi:MAG: hypothetical protein JWM38_2004 [Sphingomonas bacterium]|nr:hypothetical protein [Sphingomonas bacterium]MDB5718577.1 hypothetical protein [Sphingomonas bacterium]